MELYKCALAVRLHPDDKPFVEDAIARFLEAETNMESPIYIHISLKLDSLNQVSEMRTAWKNDK